MFPSLILAAALTAAPSQSQQLLIENCEFGETYAYAGAECQIVLRNIGKTPLHIKRIVPDDPQDTVEPSASVTVKAAQEVKLKIRIGSDVASGLVTRQFALVLDDTAQSTRYASATGYIGSVLDDPRPSIDFGNVRLGARPDSRRLTLVSRAHGGLTILSVVEAPEFVDVTVDKDGRTLEVTYKSSAPWGRRQDHVVVELGNSEQPKVRVGLTANLIGEIAPETNPFSLGILRTNTGLDAYVSLRSSEGKPFRTGKVDLLGIPGAVGDVLACEPVKAGCQRIHIKGGSLTQTGALQAAVIVELPEFKRQLTVDLAASVLPPGADPDQEAVPTEEQKRLMGDPQARGANDIRELIKAKVKESNDPPPSGKGPLLKWSVANEEAVYGYEIFRSDSEQGPYVRVNDKVIPTGKFEIGYANAYQWRDTTTVSGQTYWYSIGLLNRDGTKDTLTGPQRVLAK